MSWKSKQALGKQKALLALLGGGAVLGMFAVSYLIFDSDGSGEVPGPTSSQIISLPSDKVDAQEVRFAQIERDIKLRDGRMQHLEGQLLKSRKREEDGVEEATNLRKEIYSLREALQSVGDSNNARALEAAQASTQSDGLGVTLPMPGLPLVEVEMANLGSEKVQNVRSSIPAGTTVKAVLVSSVDAPCGVTAAADPHPVKLRLLDDGHLPNNVRARLKGGLLIASSYGELSSERVYIRLERMTQVKPNGDYVETEITGFVSGEDGKYGLRGVVVDRSGELVKSAAFSGALSGMSKFFQATVDAHQLHRRGHHSGGHGLDNLDILKAGAADGGTSSLDKLSEYYINRAEQLQPVIQIGAGRVVDITFTHGADVGDLHTKDKVKAVREFSRTRGERV
jgi:conjugal transfer pilus assembly protein TraB